MGSSSASAGFLMLTSWELDATSIVMTSLLVGKLRERGGAVEAKMEVCCLLLADSGRMGSDWGKGCCYSQASLL